MADAKSGTPSAAKPTAGAKPGAVRAPKMDGDQIAANLHRVSEWSENGGTLQRTFQFKDFAESMRFVNRVAEQAELDQHHPDILVRWNKVTLTLSTHDAGGITEKDFALASKADGMAAAIRGPEGVRPDGPKRARK